MKVKKVLFFLSILSIIGITLLFYEPNNADDQKLSTSLPIIKIVVEDGVFPTSKDSYLQATVTITDDNSFGNVGEQKVNIRARGNSTLKAPKKSYKLKFNDKVSLINDGEYAKDWVLLANYVDVSMMRNYYSLELAGKLNNLRYVPDSTFVEVYVNDVYQGVYQLSETIEVDENRLHINDTITNSESNGLLIERDAWNDSEYSFTVNDQLYGIKSDIHNEKQAAYAENIINNAWNAILSHDEKLIKETIDIPSSIDIYLLNEFTKNVDVGWSSFFMYTNPESEKLFFGPPWDFDLSLGNREENFTEQFEGLYVGNPDIVEDQSHEWFQELMKQEWYQIQVKDRWNSVKHLFLETKGEIYETSVRYREAFDKDQDLWQTFGVDEYLDPYPMLVLTTHEQHILYLCNWINDRYYWLDNYFNNEMLEDK